MHRNFVFRLFSFLSLGVFLHAGVLFAQSGNSGTISGVAKDPSGAVVAGAEVSIHNPVSGYDRSTTTDSTGSFTFSNIPLNPYHLSVEAKGFGPFAQDVDVRSSVPVPVNVALTVAGSSSTVTVEGGGDLIENDSTFHTDVDRALFDKLPLESQSSSVSSLVTLSTPGVAADSNGLFHGLGDHAENSFSVDGQPITDQQSKVFSNQIPLNSIESLEVISGAPPAEYGDKTSLIINVTTRSGLGETTPHGSVHASYGSFGSATGGFDFGYGGQKWGNFISVDGLNTGRFLDPPEFRVMHDKGNEENVFDRVDYQLTAADSLHLNAGYSRSWFQTPNSFDAQNATPWNGIVVANGGLDPNGNVVGPTDQRSKIGTFNVAPSWNHLFSSTTVLTAGFLRAARRVQLLSERRSFRRSGTLEPPAGDGDSRSIPTQRRGSGELVVREGHSQRESGSRYTSRHFSPRMITSELWIPHSTRRASTPTVFRYLSAIRGSTIRRSARRRCPQTQCCIRPRSRRMPVSCRFWVAST